MSLSMDAAVTHEAGVTVAAAGIVSTALCGVAVIFNKILSQREHFLVMSIRSIDKSCCMS